MDKQTATFVVDGGQPCSLDDLLTENAADEGVCEWAKSAAVGESYPAIVECVRVS